MIGCLEVGLLCMLRGGGVGQPPVVFVVFEIEQFTDVAYTLTKLFRCHKLEPDRMSLARLAPW